MDLDLMLHGQDSRLFGVGRMGTGTGPLPGRNVGGLPDLDVPRWHRWQGGELKRWQSGQRRKVRRDQGGKGVGVDGWLPDVKTALPDPLLLDLLADPHPLPSGAQRRFGGGRWHEWGRLLTPLKVSKVLPVRMAGRAAALRLPVVRPLGRILDLGPVVAHQEEYGHQGKDDQEAQNQSGQLVGPQDLRLRRRRQGRREGRRREGRRREGRGGRGDGI